MRWLWLAWLSALLASAPAQAQSSPANLSANLPAKPSRYVSDRAFVLDEPKAAALNDQLANFERETSNQVVVAIFNSLPAGAELAQYSTQVFRAWQVGQADKDNGVVLFIYQADRKLFIATGRGMEGALPDVLCKQIIEKEIVPRFRQGDFAGGIQSGVDAILAATKGEYRGTGQTVRDSEKKSVGRSSNGGGLIFFLIVCVIVTIVSARRRSQDGILSRRGFFNYGSMGVFGQGSSWGDSGGGGWGGSGGDGGGDSGGFSSGGGDSGGGGAGGSW